MKEIDRNEKILRELQQEVWALSSEVRTIENSYTQYSTAKATEAVRKVKAGKERFLETLKQNQRLAEAATERAVTTFNKKLEEYQKQYEDDRSEIVARYLERQASLDAEEESALEAVRRSYNDKRRKLAEDEKKAIAQKEGFLKERTRKVEGKIEVEKKDLDSKIQTYFLVEIGKLYEEAPQNIVVGTPSFPPTYYKKKDLLKSKETQLSILQKVIAELKDKLFAATDAASTDRQRREIELLCKAERDARMKETAALRAQVAEENRVAREAQKREEAAEYVARKEANDREGEANKKRNMERAIQECEELVQKAEDVLSTGVWVDEEGDGEKIPITERERKTWEATLKKRQEQLEEKKANYQRCFPEEEAPAAPSVPKNTVALPQKRIVKIKKKAN